MAVQADVRDPITEKSAVSTGPTATGPDQDEGKQPQTDEPDTALQDQTISTSLERWNQPQVNRYRYLAANFGLFIMGMNDSCIGALIPYIEPYYGINYTQVSTLFIVPFVGYLVAGLVNNLVHHHFGQRGVAFLGPGCRLIGYISMALHPPFPVLPVMMLFAGFGNGIEDSAWNAWIGNMHRANELLGFLHGAYGLGGVISPLVASAMVTKAHLQWYTYYYVMIGVTVAEAVCTLTAFWRADGAVYRRKLATGSHSEQQAGEATDEEGVTEAKRVTTRQVLKQPITWLIALFLLGYVGAEVSLGGWIVTFMLQVRHAENFLAGLTVTLFWLGLTIGRVSLGFVTGRIGEKLAITGYLLASIGLEILYWLVPNFAASVVFVILLGFFLGPLFPAAIVAATKLLPPAAHVSAIGFAAAFGGGGAAIFPFAVGAIAQSKGVEVLQPIVVAIFVFITILWLILPGGFRRNGLERAREENERPGAIVLKLKAKVIKRHSN